MKKILFIIGFLSILLLAQANDKLSTSTQAYLANRTENATGAQRAAAQSGSEMMEAFITLTKGASLSRAQALGVKFNAKFGDLYTAQIPISRLEEISNLPEVVSIDVSDVMEEQSDSTRSRSFVDEVQNGLRFGLSENYDGRGIVIGIIDHGIDFNHAAFQDSLGHTRIKHLYMPTKTTGDTIIIDGLQLPGSEFDSTKIASLTCDVSGFGTSHGTHTLGVAAGTRVGEYGGMAPGADLIVCALATASGSPNATTTANCMKYIQYWAKKMGKPCVITMSLGTQKGPHDGSSDVCKAFDNIASQGPIVCLSAGNTGGGKFCLRHEFNDSDATKPGYGTLIKTNRSGYLVSTSINTWSRTADKVSVKYLLIDPKNDSIVWESPIINGYKYFYIGSGNESKYGYSPELSQWFSNASKIGTWTYTNTSNKHFNIYTEATLKKLNDTIPDYQFAVEFYGANGVKMDSWCTSSYSTFESRDSIGDYMFVAGDDSCSINDSSTGFYTISVGNVIGRRARPVITGGISTDAWNGVGVIHSTSSYGYDANGVAYPFVIAPGYNVISSVNHWCTQTSATNGTNVCMKSNPFTGRMDYWGVMTGTSMATPAVAGIIALWLQANPSLTLDSVRTIIKQTAIRDSHVLKGGIKYGNGLINALGGFPNIQFPIDSLLHSPKYTVGNHWALLDSTLTAMYITKDGKTIYAKDSNGFDAPSVADSTQIDYLGKKFDQSNWIEIQLTNALTPEQAKAMVGHRLKNVSGTFTNKVNPTLTDALTPDTLGIDSTATLNSFIPANIVGSQLVDSVGYFFVTPKAMEIDTLTNAVWNAKTAQFTMPVDTTLALNGTFKPNFSKMAEMPPMKDESTYELIGLTQRSTTGVRTFYPLEILREIPVVHTLAEVANSNMVPNSLYVLKDSDLTIMHVSPDHKTLYVKDNNHYLNPSVKDSTQVDILSGNYDQSNWMTINLPTALDSAAFDSVCFHHIKNVTGILKDSTNLAFDVDALPTVMALDSVATINTFIPANYKGNQTVDSVNYFFVTPKTLEIDTIGNAMWNAKDSTFVTPQFYDYAVTGAITPDFSLYEGTDSVELQNDHVYSFVAITKKSATGLKVFPIQMLSDTYESHSLAQLINDKRAVINKSYIVSDSDLTVMHIAPDGKTIYAKDNNHYLNPCIKDSTQVDYLGDNYDQSNWLAITLPEALDSTQMATYPGHYLTGLSGVLTNKQNPAISVDSIAVDDKSSTTALNNFIPANFSGSQVVDSISYFFVTPKPLEIDTIRNAMWNAKDSTFVTPSLSSIQFAANAKVDFSKFEGDSLKLKNGCVYDFATITMVADSSYVTYPLNILTEYNMSITLAEAINNSKVITGLNYDISDSDLVVMHIAPDGKTLYAKDNNHYLNPCIKDSTQVDYLGGTYDQSNWVAIALPTALDSTQMANYSGHYLAGLSGVLTNKQNPTLSVDSIVVDDKSSTTALNNFIPANFTGSQVVDSVNYFFVTPKPLEIDTVTNAMWNATDSTFITPILAEIPFVGTVKADFSLYEGTDSLNMKDGYTYSFTTITTADSTGMTTYPLQILQEKPAIYSLEQLINIPRAVVGKKYLIADSDLVVMHIAPDGKTLYAKDDNEYLNPCIKDSTQVDYLGGDSITYDQSNWVAITLQEALDSTQMVNYPGHYLTALSGILKDKKNPTFAADSIAVDDKSSTTVLNNFIPANFTGSQVVDSVNYFFVTPKPLEIDTVHSAMWNADSTFTTPSYADLLGIPAFTGVMKTDFSLFEGDTLALTTDRYYDLLVISMTDENGALKVYPLQLLDEHECPHILGDVNCDGYVDIADVTLLINIVLNSTEDEKYMKYSDINADGYVDIADITILINMILNM